MNWNFTRFMMKRALFTLLILNLFSFSGIAQLTITNSQTALQLAQKLTGTGVTVTNATLSCPATANGKFTAIVSNLGIDSGIVLTDGTAASIFGTPGVNGAATLFANTSFNGGSLPYAPGDADLNTLLASNQSSNDACKLEFDFVPAGDSIKFDYVFGSEEYFGFSCSQFNDVFGFFISGPGITGVKNIALIPGTTIPVAVNSTTNTTLTNPTSITLCTQMGTGSPFSQYFVDNRLGTTVTYGGFTTVLTAQSQVIPCATYHLKLAVGDVGDDGYDSGVFLKAGSLNSNTLTITSIGSGGLAAPTPYAVRNCLPGKFVFRRPNVAATPLTVKYQIQGTAVNGVDYITIPDSVVIPANAISAERLIYAQNPATGTKEVLLKILSPYTCGNGTPLIIDSARISIFDQIKVHALTNDTTICRSESVQLRLERFNGDTSLIYTWTPATGLNSNTIDTPIATPTVTTNYIVSSNFPAAGCPSDRDTVKITVIQPAVVNAGPDITTCLGTPFTFNVNVSPVQNYVYSWTPAASLSSATVKNPVFTPTVATGFVPYIIKATPDRAACANTDTILVRVLPNDFDLITPDTTVCLGATVQIQATGDPAFTYTWTPATGVSNPNVLTPTITPVTPQLYTVTASYPTCPDVQHTIDIRLEPTLEVHAGPDLEKCQWDIVTLHADVIPASAQGYIYTWSPDSNLNAGNLQDVVFSGYHSADIVVTASTPIGCKGSDTVHITVHEGDFASLTAQSSFTICPGDSVQLAATGGITHQWTPGYYLSDSTSATPLSKPPTSYVYTDIVTDQFGCYDTLQVNIKVNPGAVLSLPDSVTLYPTETYQINPGGNCLYFTWFPAGGLNNPAISNPVASPEVNTRYFVTAITEAGCTAKDSIDINRAETVIDMPNAFAPGNSANPIFKPSYRGAVTLKSFVVYNRWGNKVFETSNINEGWNGQFNGQPQPMGVFVYKIEAVTSKGRVFIKQGNVTLIR